VRKQCDLQQVSLKPEAFAQARGVLSLRRDYKQGSWGFRELLLRRGHLAWARWFFAQKLGFPPERVLERKPMGKPLLLSPRWDELTWAKIVVLPHCSSPVKSKIHPKQYTKHIHFKAGTIQSPEIHNKTQTQAKYA